jgi:hypothetical protein
MRHLQDFQATLMQMRDQAGGVSGLRALRGGLSDGRIQLVTARCAPARHWYHSCRHAALCCCAGVTSCTASLRQLYMLHVAIDPSAAGVLTYPIHLLYLQLLCVTHMQIQHRSA